MRGIGNLVNKTHWIGPRVTLGRNVIIEDFVQVGYPKTDEPTVIEDGVFLGSGTIVYSGCKIGADSRIYHGVILRERTIVGRNTKIGSGVMCEGDTLIGDDVSVTSQCHLTSHMRIADKVFMGPNCTTLNTRHIVHERPWLGKPQLKGPSLERGARIGGHVCILPGVVVGEQAFIGAGSVVTRDVPPFKIAYGVPARVVGEVPPEEWLKAMNQPQNVRPDESQTESSRP